MSRPTLRAALLAATITVAPLVLAAPAAADDNPFADPAATGALTLCDVRGHAITSGSIDRKPFVWRAVGSVIPAGYDGAGRTATLQGFQPIKDVAPSQWVGDYLTGTSTYTSTTRPMAAATAVDRSLADLLDAYPTKWDGLVQLRTFVGAPGKPIGTLTYNAATIRVSGGRWTLVSGGTSGCDSGTARSGEEVLPEVRKLGTPAPNATTTGAQQPRGSNGAPGSGSSHRAGTPSGTASIGAAPGVGGGAASPVAAAPSSTASDGSAVWPWFLVGAAVLALAAGAVLRRRLVAARPHR